MLVRTFQYTQIGFWDRKMDLVLGPHLQQKTCWKQVGIMLMWVQWLRSRVLAGKRIVSINIDETPLVRQMMNRRGYALETAGHMEQEWHARITTRGSRSHATLLAAVTACPELQRYLPQFVLTKDIVLTKADKDK